jgi:hypothetical protein
MLNKLLDSFDCCCQNCSRSPACRPFCRGAGPTCIGIFLLVLALGLVAIGLTAPPTIEAHKASYIADASRSWSCWVLCDVDHSWEKNSTACCNLQSTQCMFKQQCYDQTVSSYNVAVVETKVCLGCGISYVVLFVLYYLCRMARRVRSIYNPRYHPLMEGAVEYRPPHHRAPDYPYGYSAHNNPYEPLMHSERIDPRVPEPAMNWSEPVPSNNFKEEGLRESVPYRDSQNICSVCLEPFAGEKAVKLKCGHIYHSQCIRAWAQKHSSCPLCRAAT